VGVVVRVRVVLFGGDGLGVRGIVIVVTYMKES
jgi:hypothetical protein